MMWCWQPCRVGTVLVVCGITLLFALLLPRSFWTVLIGLILIALGLLIRRN